MFKWFFSICLVALFHVAWSHSFSSKSTALSAFSSADSKYANHIKANFFVSGLVNTNSTVHYYMENFLNKLTAFGLNGRKVEIFLTKNKEKNASAWLGGYVVFNSGIIDIFSSEGEMAAILAHELGHISLGHIEQKMNRSLITEEFLGSILAGLLTKNIFAAGILASGIANNQSTAFSREKEREADLEAVKIMHQSIFYTSKDLIAAFRSMAKHFSSDYIEYFQTHPLPQERLANVIGFLNQLEDEIYPTLYESDAFFTKKLPGLKTYAKDQYLSPTASADKKKISYGFLMFRLKSAHFHQGSLFALSKKGKGLLYETMLIKHLKGEENFSEENTLRLKAIQNPYAQHLLASIYFSQNKRQKALETIVYIQSEWVDFYPAWVLESSVYANEKNWLKAFKVLENYVSKQDNNWLLQDKIASYNSKTDDRFSYWLNKSKALVMQGYIKEAGTLLLQAKSVLENKNGTYVKKKQIIENEIRRINRFYPVLQ